MGKWKKRINPPTKIKMTKILKKICSSEKKDIPGDLVDTLISSSAGDLRNAVNTLQLYCRNLQSGNSTSRKSKNAIVFVLPFLLFLKIRNLYSFFYIWKIGRWEVKT